MFFFFLFTSNHIILDGLESRIGRRSLLLPLCSCGRCGDVGIPRLERIRYHVWEMGVAFFLLLLLDLLFFCCVVVGSDCGGLNTIQYNTIQYNTIQYCSSIDDVGFGFGFTSFFVMEVLRLVMGFLSCLGVNGVVLLLVRFDP